MFPKTLDEITSEQQNEMLAKNEMPEVKDTDNHTTHIYTHYMVQPKTWAVWMHIEEHEAALAKQKQQEALAQTVQNGVVQSPQQGSINPGAEQSSPMAAASPLKTATTQSLNNQP